MNTLYYKLCTELENLKKECTKEELSKLSINILTPDSRYKCIYGQLTGNCFSDRAHELLIKCTVPYSQNLWCDGKEVTLPNNATWEELILHSERNFVFSPLEYYISLPKANSLVIIKYLRNIRKKLPTKEELNL